MSEKGKPKIISVKESKDSKKDWTKITFSPDLARFAGMASLDKDIVALMTKRVHDIAGSNKGITVRVAKGVKVIFTPHVCFVQSITNEMYRGA